MIFLNTVGVYQSEHCKSYKIYQRTITFLKTFIKGQPTSSSFKICLYFVLRINKVILTLFS